ncbi:MAG TPA: hypothetical protein VF103_18910, partial [Polyangiaceae bacterium]
PSAAVRSVKAMKIGWICALLSFGCASDPAGPGAAGSRENPACKNEPATFEILDDSNYTFTSSLSVEMTTLKDATDLVFDWSGLTRDFFGKAVDPATDIDLVLISLWNQTPAELEESIARDDLERSANEGAVMTYPDGTYTSQDLLSFGVLGNPLPDENEIWSRFDTQNPAFDYPQDQHTFLLMASSGTTPGRGARMLSLFNLDPSSTQTELSLTNDSASLDYTVDLSSASRVAVPTGQPSLTIDWNQMTRTALGNEFLPSQITQAVAAHFSTDSLPELEAQFLNLDELADGWWSGAVVSGTSIDLGTLTDAGGATFPGIDDEGTWLVALFCTAGCNNPAPWSITILSACE